MNHAWGFVRGLTAYQARRLPLGDTLFNVYFRKSDVVRNENSRVKCPLEIAAEDVLDVPLLQMRSELVSRFDPLARQFHIKRTLPFYQCSLRQTVPFELLSAASAAGVSGDHACNTMKHTLSLSLSLSLSFKVGPRLTSRCIRFVVPPFEEHLVFGFLQWSWTSCLQSCVHSLSFHRYGRLLLHHLFHSSSPSSLVCALL